MLVGQNPGEGSDPVSKRMNSEYRAKLEAFLEREKRIVLGIVREFGEER